ncbi:hypothetical protein BDR06DRAFT_973584 [Suillus hirtellus]|nr:hypothetical protein BDR06DRAFT_973584 [Suillus hirtellus]
MKLSEDLAQQTHQIGNIEITHSDLKPLLSSDCKIPGDGDDNCDYVIFSSCIAPLTTGQVQTSSRHGSIEGHILQATTTGVPADELLAHFHWVFSLCGDNPSHWVLEWVDYKLNEVGIFNLILEIKSKTWAKPMLLSAANMVLNFIGKPTLEWSKLF